MSKDHYNLYDFLGYILPGFLLLGGVLFSLQRYFDVSIMNFISNSMAVESTAFIIFSFIIGHLIQGFSNPIEKIIYKIKWNGYPSNQFLDKQNKHFSQEYKNKLKEKLYNQFDLTEKSSNKELFNSAYCYLIQKGCKGRIERFLALHGFYRGLMISCGALFLLFLTLFVVKNLQTEILIFAMVLFIATIIFYKRFIRFSVYFADTVYREFFVCKP